MAKNYGKTVGGVYVSFRVEDPTPAIRKIFLDYSGTASECFAGKNLCTISFFQESSYDGEVIKAFEQEIQAQGYESY